MDILSSNKVLQLEPLAPLIRQGERLADNPVFVLPKMRDGIDQTALAWEIRATSDHDTIVIQSLTADLTGTDIRLPWVVEGEFTAVAGALYITLCGKSATSDIVVKYVGSTALRVLAAEEGAYTPPANLFEDAVKAGSIAAAAASSAAQSAVTAESSKTSAAASANAAGISAASAAESKQSAAASAAAAAESAKQVTVPGRNIGDNTDFTDLVNQRIATTYTAPTSTSVMTIDRWGIITGQLEVVNGAIILTPGTMFFQNINPIEVAESETHTLSIEFDNGTRYSVTGTFLPFSEVTTPYGKLGLYKGTYPQIAFTASVRCGIKNIKIEKGQVATPYVKKGRAAEAAECKRYYRDLVVNASRVAGNMFSVSQTIDMRTAPTYTIMAFSPYGAANVTNFAGCSMEVTKEFITYANLPTCAAHACGGLRVLLSADLL